MWTGSICTPTRTAPYLFIADLSRHYCSHLVLICQFLMGPLQSERSFGFLLRRPRISIKVYDALKSDITQFVMGRAGSHLRLPDPARCVGA